MAAASMRTMAATASEAAAATALGQTASTENYYIELSQASEAD